MKPEIILALITVLSSLLTFFLAYKVGDARRKTKSFVLDKKQSEEVVIANRVHMNQVENMVVYLPVFWVAGIFGPIALVAPVGLIWFISRVVYSVMYVKNPAKREVPFIVGVACIAVTTLMALYGLVIATFIFR